MSLIDAQSPRPRAVIFGIEAKELSQAERDFFAAANPLGFIIFARNCDNPAQLRKLTDDLRAAVGRNAPVLVDQEGGRVARMKPPHWTAFPAASHYGDACATDKKAGQGEVVTDTRKLAAELLASGVTVNCAPVLDVRYPETHDAIGNRAYSQDPVTVGELGGLISDTYLQSGIVPIIKHIPGQGRATLDSHKALPRVAATMAEMDATDFAPYRDILKHRFASAVWGMVSHIVYEAVDTQHPASCSAKVINDVIRRHLAFDGLLLSDDLSMDALSTYGDEADRAVHVLKAGCDIALHCNGKLDEMKRVAAKMPPMTDIAVDRYNRSVRWMQQNKPAA
ncbi:MAG: beta-N-acetylhexosaminidase [Alphaproteobacteria bacterium]|nr:beta-N-acetylhexosaminidase [Alphaproteobacteria bacterium]